MADENFMSEDMKQRKVFTNSDLHLEWLSIVTFRFTSLLSNKMKTFWYNVNISVSYKIENLHGQTETVLIKKVKKYNLKVSIRQSLNFFKINNSFFPTHNIRHKQM